MNSARKCLSTNAVRPISILKSVSKVSAGHPKALFGCVESDNSEKTDHDISTTEPMAEAGARRSRHVEAEQQSSVSDYP